MSEYIFQKIKEPSMKRAYLFIVLICMAALPFTGCGDSDEAIKESLQPNSLGEQLTCTQIKDDQCVSDESSFPVNTPEIFATVIVSNATVGARATCTLTYLGDTPEDLASFEITINQITRSLRSYLVFNFTNDEPWQPGKYRVTTKMDAGSPPVSKEFSFQ